MLAGKTYTINCDVTVNAGDSLIIQPGVHLIFNNQAGLIVKGNLFSLGTKSAPIWMTVAGQKHTDAPKIGFKAKNDSAFSGLWKGIAGDVTCQYLIIKWTHLEYCGALGGANGSNFYKTEALSSGTKNSYPLFFSNTNGIFVFEDSWLYGCPDDAIRIGGAGARFAIMRCTFERCGKTGGDGLNIKQGGVGILAYNLCIGGATNSLKAANTGTAPGLPTCHVDTYNNTVVNSGYRSTGTGKGGSINYEDGARGKIFNNLLINCKFGLRLNGGLVPDTGYLYAGNYGYNYYWADSLSVANEIIPFGPVSVTKPVATDYPNLLAYLTPNYKYVTDAQYDGSPVVQLAGTNPLFKNYPLPVTGGYLLGDINAVGNFKFTLQPNSPCIGKGYRGFTPLQNIPIDPKYGLTELTLPGADVGCYQFDGTGNQHF